MAHPIRIMGGDIGGVDNEGIQAQVNSEGRLDVVQHAHPNNGWVHFVSGTLTASQDFILIDISDTTNYPHTDTNYIHLESMRIHTDPTSNANYTIKIGFLKNVDATNGDFYNLVEIDGEKTAGQIQNHNLRFYPNGPKCSSDFVALNPTLNDTAFQTDVNLASTLDQTTANVPSGNGDLVVRYTHTAGTSVSFGVSLSYHTHDGG